MKKMYYTSKNTYKNIIFFLILFSVVYTKNTIEILFEKPDFVNENYCESYSSLINSQFNEINNNNNNNNPNKDDIINLQDIHIHFSCHPNLPNKGNSKLYNEYILKQLANSTYDMFILDDKFLFSDVAFIKSQYINEIYNIEDEDNQNNFLTDFLFSKPNKNIHTNFLNLSKYIQKEKLSYHDSKVLNDGYLDHQLFGLPYELDYDILYYYSNSKSTSFNQMDMKNIGWGDLYSHISKNESNSYSLNMGLGNDDELLNIFLEYVNNESIDISGEYNYNKNFKMFYNEESKELYNSFREFIIKSSSLDLNKKLNMTLEDTHNYFLKDESHINIFKGKVSNYDYFFKNIHNTTIETTLLPKNTSVLNKKYLIINNQSKLDKKLLTEVAYQLTSKDMQIFRFEKFGSIPTFDISQKQKDKSIENFCLNHSEQCEILEKMKKIHIKDVFKSKSKFNAPFMEIRILLPPEIRNFLRYNEYSKIMDIFENIETLIMDKAGHMDILKIILYLPSIIFTVISIMIIFIIFKYRKNPYIKSYSPLLCNLVIISFIMEMHSPYLMIHYKTIEICYFFDIYHTISTNLMLLPVIAITYRIYTIYNNKSKINFGQKLNNKNLFIFVFSTLLVMTLFSIYINLNREYYILSYGNIETFRNPSCITDDRKYSIIEFIIYRIMVSFIIINY